MKLDLFVGEHSEVVTIDTIRELYGQFNGEPCTFAEYLQNVTGSGGYYMAVNYLIKTEQEFLQMADLQSMDDLQDTEMYLLDHSIPGIKYAIANSDDYGIVLIKE